MVDSSDKARKAFQYLKDNGRLHSQQDLADAMAKDKGYISKMLKPGCATGSFFQDLCKAFPGMFNLNYFLNGEGDMLMEQHQSSAAPQSDILAQLLRLVNNLSEDVRSLKSELKATKLEVLKLKRAHYGYASVAADGGTGIEEFEEVK